MEELARESITLLASASAEPQLDAAGPRLGSLGAIFIMLKSALGAGLLNFPSAFERAGGIRSAVTKLRTCMLKSHLHGLIILGYSSSISGQCTYQAVIKEVCGPAIGQLCEICYVFNLFMIAVAFLVIVDDQLKKCEFLSINTDLNFIKMPYHFYTDQRFALVLLCVLLILPLSVPKEISIQKYIRSCVPCVCAHIQATSLRLVTCIKADYYIIFIFISLFQFHFLSVFQCHEASITIYSSMENQRLSHWVFISVASMIFCLIIYSLTGVYGYLTFGTDVKADILMSYTSHDILMLIARLLFGVSIITIYPIILLLGRSVIQDPLLSWWRRRYGLVTVELESRSRYMLTILWITATLFIAVFVPDISKVIGVIGGISAFFIFIFPGNTLVIDSYSVKCVATLKPCDCFSRTLHYLNLVTCFLNFGSQVCWFLKSQT
uniref:Solute carrier family 38 member 8a n=1 Tax=Mastacembelus armatus TaxID=205130 RepID=A0A7N8XGL0_9TELE